jgi:prepilin-type N-terminal cleavage/methylation domain-containing protein
MAKGFTLVELLIVIGILAVLSAAVVVVLQPAELLKQARDTQRMQDLNGIHNALMFYVVSTTSPTFGETLNSCVDTADGGACGDSKTATTNTTRTTGGAGWVGVDLDELTGGSPLSTLPVDPVNTTTYHYCYDGDDASNTWELNTILESAKFMTAEDKDGTDGGDAPGAFEIGNDPSLNLI